MSTIYDGSITLSKLKSTIVEGKGKDDQPVKGIFIPLELNHFTVKESAVYMPIRVVIHDKPDKHDQDGFISQKSDPEIWKAADDAKKEELFKLPILGNFRNFGEKSKTEADKAPVSDSLDKLPF